MRWSRAISGRPADFLHHVLGSPAGVELIGLYGLGHVGPDATQWRSVIGEVVSRALEEAPSGVYVEPKGLTVTLHWRHVPEAGPWATAFAARMEHGLGVRTQPGRMSVEVRPPLEVDNSGAPKDQSFDPTNLPALKSSPRKELSRKVRLPENKTLLMAVVNYRTPDGTRYIIEVGAPLDPVETMLDRLFLQLALGLPIAVLVAIGGGYLLVGRALAPVDQMAGKASQITQHNLGERLPVARTADELERLSLSLNHMIGRLEDAFLNEKRFIADASHELRTPLTTMRAELESLVSDGRLTPDSRESLGSILEEVERLTGIVEGLSAISRLDAGEAKTEWVQFDLSELAATTADQMSLLAEDKGITVRYDARQPVMVAGDRARLKQVVVNLLDNAIKYTPEKGAIHLRVSAANGHALLEVSDNGIGIPADALPHVFDRFFRVDKARTRDPGGAGLGLSIVKSICAAHGATVEAFSNRDGSLFRVTLPAIQAGKS